MRSKFLNIFTLILNSILSLGAVCGIAIIFVYFKLDSFVFLDTYLLLLTFISCVIGMAYNILTFSHNKQSAAPWFLDLKLVTVSLCVSNAIIVFGLGFEGNFSGQFIIPRVILPILLLLTYVLLEIEPKFSYRGLIFAPVILIIYLSVTLSLIATGKLNAPHEYLDALNNPWYITLASVAVLAVITLLVSLILHSLNRLGHFLVISRHAKNETSPTDWMPKEATSDPDKVEEILREAKKEETIDDISLSCEINEGHVEEQPQEEIIEDEAKPEIKEEPVIEVKQEETKPDDSGVVITDDEIEEKPTDTKSITRVYHISHHKSQPKWQVKLAGSARAVKLFKTQKEAIDYAKELVKSQGGSYLVHGVDGKIRKG